MKSTLVLSSFMLAILSVQAQDIKESEVPAVVKEKFATMYPSVTNAKWEKEENGFEAEWMDNRLETSTLFDARGNFVHREEAIQTSAYPAGVMDYVAKNLAKQKIAEAEKITDAAGVITYKAEIAGADYIFDSNGKFVRKESEKEDDGEDDESE